MSIRTQLLHGNARNLIDGIDQMVDLVITSPPYNINKEYETKKSLEKYLADQTIIIEKLVSKLSDTGSICWQVGNFVDKKNKEVYPLDIFFYDIFKKLGLTLKNRIIWRFGHGLHAKTKFSGRYETILWFVKTNEYKFNLDPIRVAQKYPGKRSYRQHNYGEFTGNPKGKNPSDVWDILTNEWDEGVWDIPNVKANHIEKSIHPCQFPISVVERCILALTDEHDWVLDPYVGVGTTSVAAKLHNRNSLGIDKYKKYLKIANNRIRSVDDGSLKYRPLNKRVFIPDGAKLKVAKRPPHFKKF